MRRIRIEYLQNFSNENLNYTTFAEGSVGNLDVQSSGKIHDQVRTFKRYFWNTPRKSLLKTLACV